MKKKLLVILLALSLVGCTPNVESTESTNKPTNVIGHIESSESSNTESIESTTEPTAEPTEPVESTVKPTESTEDTTIYPNFLAQFPTTDFEVLRHTFGDVELDPENLETPIASIELNENKPLFKDYTTEEFEKYSDLDIFGRCGTAFANISKTTIPTEERGQIGQIKPSGWHTSNYNEYPGLVDGNYLYNRCHLIAFMLAGENANEKNLITGTRYLNIKGMLPYEDMVHDYMEENPNNHVMYRVTPAYFEDELLARGVIMEAYSVEDNGKLQFCVWCYNLQPDIVINYANGDNHYYKEETETTTTEPINVSYILNTNSKKIHLASCSAVKDMKPQNKEVTDKSYEELISEGYTPCGLCKPGEN